MFGLFKSKTAVPAGPYAFTLSIEIDRPASEIYALVDWADPRNSKRQLGHEVSSVGGAADRFRMVMTEMPDLLFDMIVSEAVPNSRYTFSTEIFPPVGRLVESQEDYAIKPLADDRCELTLTVMVIFQDNMSEAEFEEEMVRMNISVHNAAQKLKIHAEEGTEAVRAANDRLIV